MAEPPPTYTREEMDAILKRAIERQQAKSEEIPHEDLVAAAGEVGIPREEVEAAARDLEAERRKTDTRDADAPEDPPPAASGLHAPRDADMARSVRLVRMLLAIAACALLVQRQAEMGLWLWPAIGLALALIFKGGVVVGIGPLPNRATMPRVSRRERKRAQRQERLAEFERKVAIGADAIVRIIDEAKGMKARLEADLLPREARPPTREQGPRVLVTPPPVRVGVDTRERDEVAREHRDDGGERQRTRRG